MPTCEAPSNPLSLTPAQFQRFAEFIGKNLGIKMAEVKMPMLQSRLQRRLRELGLRSVEEYQEHLFGESGATELEEFINAVTTNKTDFFRESKHFEFLARVVLPEFTEASARSARFKLWCAGCSSGEEAYTQAMVLQEHARAHPEFNYSILATDISTRVLRQAEAAVYDETEIEPIPDRLRRQYLLRSRHSQPPRFRIAPVLRDRVQFHRLNFMEPRYPIGDVYDAIFIRNVMIYFDRRTQEAVVNRLCEHLKPEGHLFIGHSESLNGLNVPVRLVGPAVYRKPAREA